MQQIVFNNNLDAVLTMFFIFVVVSILFYTIVACLKASREDKVQPRSALRSPSDGENLTFCLMI